MPVFACDGCTAPQHSKDAEMCVPEPAAPLAPAFTWSASYSAVHPSGLEDSLKAILQSHMQDLENKLEVQREAHDLAISKLWDRFRRSSWRSGQSWETGSCDLESESHEFHRKWSSEALGADLRTEVFALGAEVRLLTKLVSEADQTSSLRELQVDMDLMCAKVDLALVKADILSAKARWLGGAEQAQTLQQLRHREKVLRTMLDKRSLVAEETERTAKVLAPAEAAEFWITLDRSVGDTLGIRVCEADGRTLLVQEVSAGLVQRWNERRPWSSGVRPGDRIVAVNGHHGDASLLSAEAAKEQVLVMTVCRGR